MTVKIRLYHPSDVSGRLICWRLESPFSHATIEFDGVIYSATVPKVVSVLQSDPKSGFSMPDRTGETYEVTLSEDETARALAYCKSMVGVTYDLLSIAGWALRIESWQRPGHPFCFELVYDAMVAAGVLPTTKRLITGDQLMEDMGMTGRIVGHSIPVSMKLRAAKQKPAIVVK